MLSRFRIMVLLVRDFRPKLVKVYNDYLDTDQAFEVLFISADRDEDAFVEFWKQMPWLALSYTDRDAAENGGRLTGLVVIHPSFLLMVTEMLWTTTLATQSEMISILHDD